MRKGQALLVVLLMLGVVLTVGLAVVSRSVTEVSISTTQEESTRALEAAEAGVEKSLAGVGSFGAPGNVSVGLPNASVVVNNTAVGNSTEYVLPYDLDTGDVATVNLAGWSGANIVVCWGDGTTQATGEIMVYTTASGTTKMRKWMIGGNSAPGAPFQAAQGSGNCPGLSGSKSYTYWNRFQEATDFASETPVLMRVRLVGNTTPQPMAFVAAGGNFPSQGIDTVSAGTSGTTTKKVRVVQVNPDVPFMFDSALFSGTSLTKP